MSPGAGSHSARHGDAFLAHAPCVVASIVADASGGLRLVRVEGNAIGLIGIRAAALVGSAAPLVALIDEDDDRAAVTDGLRRVITAAHRFQSLVWLRGRPLRLAAQAGPPVDGAPSAVVVITDATAEADERSQRVRAEMRFRKAFMAAPGLFAISTPADGRHVDVNDLWLRTMEWRREEVIGRTAAELGVWADPADRARIVAALDSQGSVRDFETRFRTRTGQVREFLVAGEVIELDGGRHLLLVAHDMTDRNAALRALSSLNADLEQRVERRTSALRAEIALREETQRDLLAAKEAAEEANRAKSAFLSSMSHELRTPMNAILGFAQLMRAIEPETLTPRNDEYIGHILSAGNHLLSLIDDVLDLSKIEAGRTTVSLEPIGLEDIFDHVVGLLAPVADRFGVAIRATPDAAAGLRVHADSVRLAQVLINLGSNAAKYNQPGGWLELSCTPSPDREAFVRIVVADNGQGIPEHRLPEVFQPFNRLGAENGVVEGTGIGLAIARQLVEMMGGTIAVSSAPGAGTTFTIELPAAAPERGARKPGRPGVSGAGAVAAGRDTAGATLAGGPWTILYIDDVSANVRLMAGVLSAYPGVRLLSAPNARNGLGLARTHRPDLVVLDIDLPDADGFAVLERLRATPELAATPVIALTARAAPRDRERGLRAGFAAYLAKPLDVDHFLAEATAALALAARPRDVRFPPPEPAPTG